ncbi:hypothetical protein WA026_018486 [Henosepilachna vigintioctopunctata]|uniref:Exonuclease domain-containing protein n=1 Tax=Henosepilachna vigintioctopunctata TaxID=420089 RepID=A0AAW1V1B7_9CUCU
MLAKLFSTQSYRNMSHEKLKIFNFAFLDLETTGLPSNEYNKTKITELSIAVVESNHIRLGVYPRIRNKLNLCFNPSKIVNPIVTELTGLANDILENQTYFSQNVVNIINEFLNLQKKPICLVAHNGNKFDYPILQADINKAGGSLNEDILCIDSLLCFQDLHNERTKLDQPSSRCNIQELVVENKEFDVPHVKRQKVITGVFSKNPTEFSDEYDKLLCDAVDEYEKSIKNHNIQKINETTPKKQVISINSEIRQGRVNVTSTVKKKLTSFKLCDIYKRLTCKDPVHSHHAEGDVDCLIHCAAAYGDDFVEWANKNAKFFSTIPAMRPGVKIGF